MKDNHGDLFDSDIARDTERPEDCAFFEKEYAKMKPVKYKNAWIVPDKDTREYGVLIRCGTEEYPYWWLLCPANATLSTGPNFDVSGCSDGEGCMWEEIHIAAEKLRQFLSNVG